MKENLEKTKSLFEVEYLTRKESAMFLRISLAFWQN